MACEIQVLGSSLGEDAKHADLPLCSGSHLSVMDEPGTFYNIDVPGSSQSRSWSRSKMGVDEGDKLYDIDDPGTSLAKPAEDTDHLCSWVSGVTEFEIPGRLLRFWGLQEAFLSVPTGVCCEESGVCKEPVFDELGTECPTEPVSSSTKPEELAATVDVIPKPVIDEIHNSGTYGTKVDDVVADPPTDVHTEEDEDVTGRVFYFDHPLLLPTSSVWHEGWEWGCRPRTHLCVTCYNQQSEHETDSCPFIALSTQFDVDFLTGMPPAPKTASLVPTLRKKKKGAASSSLCMSDFPPVLSRAERTAANLMRRREMNLVRISNNLHYSKDRELEELFKRFGRVTHSYIPYPSGNGFVNFVRRVDALRAMKNMNGYEFEGLKLRVVWAYLDSTREDMS